MEQATNDTHLLRTLSNQLADAVERVSSALVLVNGRQRQPASGVVYAQGLVLTANHVLEREEDLTVQTHDQRTLPAQFVGRDLATDLAVLRVADLGIKPAIFAEEEARVGQLVLAVGRTSHEGPMASSGIVSTIGGPIRTARGVTLERYIRTDATPYPGFSGGPLVDAQGHVVGILTTGLVHSVALAIPMNITKGIADTLAQQGYIKRGYLGISSQLIQIPVVQRAGRSQERGLLIVKVEESSPAQRGGMLLGDILVALDSHEITDSEDLQVMLTGDRVDKAIPVEVIRGNILQTLQVIVGQRT
ncbi:MAG TPA: trypsin-like peptidase domain-containing protein [Ktedonobacteraceae bacterium]|jgi:S1-C subfamily serine protease|nr:trypsin-like peptidase domain-containing protein [Ktedonobacteraceae bacterium]